MEASTTKLNTTLDQALPKDYSDLHKLSRAKPPYTKAELQRFNELLQVDPHYDYFKWWENKDQPSVLINSKPIKDAAVVSNWVIGSRTDVISMISKATGFLCESFQGCYPSALDVENFIINNYPREVEEQLLRRWIQTDLAKMVQGGILVEEPNEFDEPRYRLSMDQ